VSCIFSEPPSEAAEESESRRGEVHENLVTRNEEIPPHAAAATQR